MTRDKSKKAKSSSSKQPVKQAQLQEAQEATIPDGFVILEEPQKNDGVIHQVVQQSYQGPIPPASELANYNDVLPDAAERILRMAELEGEHVRSMEKLSIKYRNEDVSRGQHYALTISLAAFATSITLATLGYPTAAGIVGGTTVVSLAVAFITGRKPTKKK